MACSCFNWRWCVSLDSLNASVSICLPLVEGWVAELLNFMASFWLEETFNILKSSCNPALPDHH